MLKRIVVAAMCVLVASGCAHRPQTWTPMPFDEAEYAALPKTGTGVVQGQVFAKTLGGNVKTGAGSVVFLMPATKFREQWYQETFVFHRVPGKDADKRYLSFDRTKTADGDGRFKFDNVPAGKYYVLSDVTWKTVSDNNLLRASGILDTQGGIVVRVVDVSDGAVTDAMLNRQ